MSPLYDAAQGGHHKVVKFLVKKGVIIHQATSQGIAPLHVAALEGHQEVVDYLMGKGATFELSPSSASAVELLMLHSSVVFA
jgi:ankyrin repeat protein